MQSKLIPETLEEGAKEVSRERIVATPSKKKEATSVTISSPMEEGVSRPASNQGETEPAPIYRQKVGAQRKGELTGRESDPRQCSGHFHR
jgi:hypothetical protein